MKRIAFFLLVCVAYSALTSAAQRKIAYEHRDNIFIADTDGTHQKKIATGALPEISPDGTRVRSTPMKIQKRGLAQNVTSQSLISVPAKSQF